MILQTGSMIGMNFSTSLHLTIALNFVFGVACVGTRAIVFLYLMDLLPRAWQVTTGTVLNFVDTSIPLLGVVYFWKISKDWIWFVVPFGEITSILVLVALVFLPESPKYLLCKKRYDEARVAINFFQPD